MTDADLVQTVLGGEPALFELVMRRYNRRLYRVARAITRDDAEAEDVVQEAYTRAYTRLAELEDRARLAAWLTRICAHEAMRRLRRKRSGVEALPEDASEVVMRYPSPAPSPEQDAVGRELAVAIESAVDALPDDFRAVFMLRAVEQLSVAETALSLDIPEETVKTRFFRARAHLKEDLARALDTQAPRAFGFDGVRCDRIVSRVLDRIQGELTRTKEKDP